MTLVPVAAAALLAALRGTPEVRERTLRPVIVREAREHHLSPRLLRAVAYRESTFRIGARSAHGDLGLFQVRRGCATRGFDGLTDAQLMEPAVNVHLGARRLELARKKCGHAPARSWLSGYAGLSCGPSTYSDHVLATMEGQ